MSDETSALLTPLKQAIHNLAVLITRAIDWFEVGVLSASIAALAILLVANVIARTFFQSIYYANEIARFLIILITFVGTSYAARKARHIRMGAFLDLMPAKLEKVFRFVICTVNSIVLLTMAYFSFIYMNQMRGLGQTTSALQAPYWIFMIIVPIGFGSAGIQYIRTIVKNIREEEVWLSPEQQSEYDEEVIL